MIRKHFPFRCIPLAVLLTCTGVGHAAPRTSPAQAKSVPVTAQPAPAVQAQPEASALRTPPPAPKAASLQQQIAAIPPLQNTGIDADALGKSLLAHLNAILRYYRASIASPQKIGEPSDALYAQQHVAQAAQTAQYAFQAARNIAGLLGKIGSRTANSASDDATDDPSQQTEAQRLATIRSNAQARLAQLTADDADLDKQIAKARSKDLPGLRQRQEQMDGQLNLQKAILDALSKISTDESASSTTGFSGDVDRLLRTAPELNSATLKPAAPPVLESLAAARDAGVSSQAVLIFQLLSTRHAIDTRIQDTDDLRKQADDLRKPMIRLLRSTMQQGQAAVQAGTDETPAATKKRYDALTATFRVLSSATLPLGQEVLMLEQGRANLVNWRAAVDSEYSSVIRSLLLRVASIGIALLGLFVLSQLWQRLTVKYVHDLRRRRQILVIRRLVLGFFTGLILILGFTTQFSSLATFAGFITAGIAVGLQTILLSVAAYFFIVGRFGVRVGDRITVAGVTGDVVEVGLVRFYMLELTGTGTELHPTGRVVVFANSILFQAGTPLYKQMPGTEYAWHELTVKLKPGSEYQPAADAILNTVSEVYAEYRQTIEAQHRQVEDWMDTALEAPHIEPRLQLAADGPQYAVLFPVEIRSAASTDEKIIRALLDRMNTNDAIKDAVAATPTITAIVKG